MDINTIAKKLWRIVEEKRAHITLRSSDYYVLVLGLSFLEFANRQFKKRERELQSPYLQKTNNELEGGNHKVYKAIYLPPEARIDYLLSPSVHSNLGHNLNKAMQLIEDNNEILRGVLTDQDFSQLDNRTLIALLKTFSTIPLGDDEKNDYFIHIYEFFLDKIAFIEGKAGDNFFTPTSVVRLIVRILEPFHGKLLDPACGSGNMFLQSAQFVAEHRSNPNQEIAIYGQEKTLKTVYLCKMNLIIHGLSGNIQCVNSFYEDSYNSSGNFDFVMANPPFNINGVDKEDIKVQHSRFPFGVPNTDNANYLWIQMFYSALNERGRAGFIMPNSANDARFSEQVIRRRLIEDLVVDVIIAAGPNFLYSIALPYTLWFLDKRKRNNNRKNTVLFIDARNIHHSRNQNNSKHRGFNDEDIEFITNIVRLYRGEVVETIHGSEAQLKGIFPHGKYVDKLGLCKIATLAEIKAQGWSLNPGRYTSKVASIIKPVPFERNLVFICYSHEDQRYLDRLSVHLTPLKRTVEIWDDTKIKAGETWHQEIKKAIEYTKVAILLISADFLASKFIDEDELPPLLKAAQTEGVVILPVILSPCGFKDTSLTDYKTMNEKPLTRMNKHEREDIWNRVASRIKEIMALHT